MKMFNIIDDHTEEYDYSMTRMRIRNMTDDHIEGYKFVVRKGEYE